MEKQLPARPNLDHLRRQAKSLLSALETGDPQAVATFLQHLPSAKGLTEAQVRQSNFRLADAQSAIARKTGFASWPQLARHVEQLRALEGTWAFASLEIDANPVPSESLVHSRLLIDGDRFRTESPEATYEGVFTINVEAQPHEIDIEFVEGPEAGNWNYGIFRLEGDQLDFCLDMSGKPRPTDFRTAPGSGHAYETLRRTIRLRPENVTGGAAPPVLERPPIQECVGFDFVEGATIARLQGEWAAVRVVLDGRELPAAMLQTGRRSATQNEVRIWFGGQLMIHALIRITESETPVHVDYFNQCGHATGAVQLGIMQWIGPEPCFCMAAPGQPRPTDFDCPVGSGRTVSQWRVKE